MACIQYENTLVIELFIGQYETVGLPFYQPAQYIVVVVGQVFPAVFNEIGEIIQELLHTTVPVIQFFPGQVEFQRAQDGVGPAL